MKKLLFLFSFLGFITLCNAQVGINTTSPSSNAALDINANIGGTSYGGLLPPRITVSQRNAMTLTAADDGLIAYVSGFSNGDRCLQLFNGQTLTWESIQCFAAPTSIPGVAFLETVGTPAANTLISVYEAANGFDNDACTFSSSTSPEADVRTTNPSNTTGASASGNVFFTNAARDLLIDNISVTSYTGPLTLQMLVYKSTTAATGSELTVEYYDSATASWTNVSFTDLPTTSATWYEKVLSTTVPNTITRFRITRSATGTAQYRIDDIKITY